MHYVPNAIKLVKQIYKNSKNINIDLYQANAINVEIIIIYHKSFKYVKNVSNNKISYNYNQLNNLNIVYNVLSKSIKTIITIIVTIMPLIITIIIIRIVIIIE
jgi:hypothetical protein